LSEIEAEEAVGSFVECPVNIHHAEELSNMFTGNLGSVRDLWVEGEWVKGEVAIPLWLDNQLTDDGKKLSAEWTLTDKRFVGLALTPTPRIDNAALMAAFKTFSTSGKSQPPVASKAATTGERKTIMPKISEAWENLKALFTAAGFEDDMTTTKTPAPTPAPVEDKEKAELATFKANIVNSKKQTVKASAIRALGQNTPGAIAAFATIDATDSLETLEAMNTTYESIAAKTMGINGGRQTTTGNDGAFSAEKLDNPDLMKKVLFALSNEEPIFGSALKTLEQKGKV
ncbi:MAG: hypothetical protein EBR82_59960, partial [Caulobacteraceae bacterium]|nr:hypothetical protein [Caulobacteraceae bacterium]